MPSCLFCNHKISEPRQKKQGHVSDVLLGRVRTASACIANGVCRSTDVPYVETNAAGVGTDEPAPDIVVPPEVGGGLGLDW